MSFAPRGNLLERNMSSLPDWVEADVTSEPDSEEARCRLLFQCALREHLKAACAKVSAGSEISFEERAESRRLLTSMCEPWLSWRRFLAEHAELDEGAIRRAAIEKLRPMIAAERAQRVEPESDAERKAREKYAAEIERQEREPAPMAPTPAPTKLATPQWGSRELLAFPAENESVLDAAEVEQGLIECERRAKRERHKEYAKNWRETKKAVPSFSHFSRTVTEQTGEVGLTVHRSA